jgi:hypothetical protein
MTRLSRRWRVFLAWLTGLLVVFLVDRLSGRTIPRTPYEVGVMALKGLTTVLSVVLTFRLIDWVAGKRRSGREK